MQKIFLALFTFQLALTLLSSCEKPLESLNQENHASQVLPETSAADRDTKPSTGILTLQQDLSLPSNNMNGQFYIVYRSSTGGTTPTFYFTEAELEDILIAAGVPGTQINAYLQTLFYSADMTGALIHEVGGFIAQGWNGLPANAIVNSYQAGVLSTGSFAPPKPPGTEYVGCPPGTITSISNICSINLGAGIVIPGGWFSGIRLRNTCLGGGTFTIGINTVQEIIDALVASGMTPAQANQTALNFRNGQMSVRDAWNLFQFRILPYLPAYQQFVQQNGGIEAVATCWRLNHVGWGIYDNINATAMNAVFLIGDAPLFCGPFT